MKRICRGAISVTMCIVLMAVSSLVVKAASVNGYFSGGSYYGTLTLTATTAKATLTASYEEDGIPDPYVKTTGEVRNSHNDIIATLNTSQRRGYCSVSHSQLVDVESAEVKFYVVNMNAYHSILSTTIYG